MTRPVLIWTFRRTGGTSLARLLFGHAGRPHWQDEALNPDRELGHITRAFRAEGDLAALEAALAAAMGEGRSLKHCLDTVPFPVSSRLIRVTAASHAHVLLLRFDEGDRIISLALAQETGAWGPEQARAVHARIRAGEAPLPPIDRDRVKHIMTRDLATLGRFQRAALRARLPLETVFFEDLYFGDVEDRIAAYRRLADRLGLPAEGPPRQVLLRHLVEAGQDSRALHHLVPNIREIRRLVERFTT